MQKGFGLLFIGLFSSILHAQIKEVKDIEGNRYLVKRIHNQEWFMSDLQVTRYANGDRILSSKNPSSWCKQDTLAHYTKRKVDSLDVLYYNWYAVNDSRGVCPTGWRVPSMNDYVLLIKGLGGTEVAGQRMKSPNYWGDTLENKEVSLFQAKPFGYVDRTGILLQDGKRACWWSITEQHVETAYSYSIGNMGDHIIRDKFYKKQGHTVRCMRDLRED